MDHVEADTFEGVIEKQRPYERTRIVDYVLNHETETVDLIHEVLDDKFFEKLKNGEIQYVSAMVWPANGGYTIKGKGRMNLPIVDAEHWKYVHHAFLKDNPAYGKDTATVKTVCEGSDCQMQMLSAKNLVETNSDPLYDLPLLYKHKNTLHLISASQQVQNIILQKKKEGVKINDKIVVKAYSMCNESNLKNSPFKACTCGVNVSKMEDTEKQNYEARLKASETEKEEMKSKLKSNEEAKKDMESKLKSKSRGRYSKLFANEKDGEDAKKMFAKLKANTEDEDELKAMEEGLEDSHKARKSMEEDPANKDMKARLKAMEQKTARPMIDDLVNIRRGKMSETELTEYQTALSSKEYSEIESQHANESYLINELETSGKSETSNVILPFNGESGKPLGAKSLESILGESI